MRYYESYYNWLIRLLLGNNCLDFESGVLTLNLWNAFKWRLADLPFIDAFHDYETGHVRIWITTEYWI